MRTRPAPPIVALVAIVAVVVTSCAAPVVSPSPSPQRATRDDAITVASFDFTESQILGELYAQAFERSGVRVVRQLRLGPRELVEPALEQGLVEFVPEYTGSLLEFLNRTSGASADLQVVRRDLAHALAGRGLVLLASAPAEDQNAFATTLAFARSHRLTKLSELAAIGPVTLGGPRECPQRPLCAAGLEATYGLEIGRFVALDLSGPLTDDALRRGLVDVAVVLTTSPMLEGGEFLVLTDDRELQPAENVTPIVHASVVERFGPEVTEIADEVSAALTTDGLRKLNAAVEVHGVSVASAVSAWLDEHGFPPASPG